MFTFKLLKNHAGIILCGDHSTFKALQDVVYQVSEKSPIITGDQEDWFLRLASDARHAYMMECKVYQPPEFFPEVSVTYGVGILWPVILMQCSLMRTAMQFYASSKLEQSLTYALEHVIDCALQDDFGTHAGAIHAGWGHVDMRQVNAGSKLNSRCVVYCSWNKKQRREYLPGLLASLDPKYRILRSHWTKNGADNLIDPDVLDSYEDMEWDTPSS